MKHVVDYKELGEDQNNLDAFINKDINMENSYLESATIIPKDKKGIKYWGWNGGACIFSGSLLQRSSWSHPKKIHNQTSKCVQAG